MNTGCGGGDHFTEQLHERGREHVHAKKAEVAASAETGDDQFLFGFSRRGFLDNGFDFVEALAARNEFATDDAIEGSLLSCVACTAETAQDSVWAISTSCCAQFFNHG